jgi:hypothetical protein
MILGLSGRARVGKNAVADYLTNEYKFKQTAFAETLKKACGCIFGLTEKQLYGDDKEIVDCFWKDTPRNILQKVGTDCLRKGYREEVWVKSLERQVKRLAPADIAITDVRFINESEAVKEWGGLVIRILRDNAPAIATDSHVSETSLDNYQMWDYTIRNDGTLEDLYKKVDEMLRFFNFDQGHRRGYTAPQIT